MTGMWLMRIGIVIVIAVVWVAIVTAGFRWVQPRGQLVKRRYLAVAVPTAAVLIATVILGILAKAVSLTMFGAIGLVLWVPVVYQQLRRLNRPGDSER